MYNYKLKCLMKLTPGEKNLRVIRYLYCTCLKKYNEG